VKGVNFRRKNKKKAKARDIRSVLEGRKNPLKHKKELYHIRSSGISKPA
jgi:hypothetical protein